MKIPNYSHPKNKVKPKKEELYERCYWFPHDSGPCHEPSMKGHVYCEEHLIRVRKMIKKKE